MGMTTYCTFLPVLLLFFGSKLVSTENESSPAEGIFKFMDNALEKLNATYNSNIILVIRNTGTGKSTLVHYVACDHSKIKAIEDDKSLEIKVRDELAPEVSRTFIP